jgi:hypothetical protein
MCALLLVQKFISFIACWICSIVSIASFMHYNRMLSNFTLGEEEQEEVAGIEIASYRGETGVESSQF